MTKLNIKKKLGKEVYIIYFFYLVKFLNEMHLKFKFYNFKN